MRVLEEDEVELNVKKWFTENQSTAFTLSLHAVGTGMQEEVLEAARFSAENNQDPRPPGVTDVYRKNRPGATTQKRGSRPRGVFAQRANASPSTE